MVKTIACRSCSLKKVLYKILQNLQYICTGFSILISFEPATLLKRKVQYMCFPVNFAQILRTAFPFTKYIRWQLLNGR